MVKLRRTRGEARRISALEIFQISIVLPSLTLLAALIFIHPGVLTPSLLFWIAVVAAVELVQVPFWRGVQVSIGFPLLLAVGMINPPAAAALVALLGSMDPRELKREVSVLRAVFNRSQVAMAVLAASATFHALTNLHQGWPEVLSVAVLAGLADYVVNVALVSAAVSIAYKVPYAQSLQRMRIGRSAEFFVNYIGLGFFGTVLGKLYVDPLIGVWAVPAV